MRTFFFEIYFFIHIFEHVFGQPVGKIIKNFKSRGSRRALHFRLSFMRAEKLRNRFPRGAHRQFRSLINRLFDTGLTELEMVSYSLLICTQLVRLSTRREERDYYLNCCCKIIDGLENLEELLATDVPADLVALVDLAVNHHYHCESYLFLYDRGDIFNLVSTYIDDYWLTGKPSKQKALKRQLLIFFAVEHHGLLVQSQTLKLKEWSGDIDGK